MGVGPREEFNPQYVVVGGGKWVVASAVPVSLGLWVDGKVGLGINGLGGERERERNPIKSIRDAYTGDEKMLEDVVMIRISHTISKKKKKKTLSTFLLSCYTLRNFSGFTLDHFFPSFQYGLLISQREIERSSGKEREREKCLIMFALSIPPIILSSSPTGHPNQQRTLDRLPTELRCRNFVTKRRLMHTSRCQKCKNMYAMCIYSN